MIEALETYLKDLMRDFNKYGILDRDGNAFQPDSFVLERDIKSFKFFDLGIDENLTSEMRAHSHERFYNPDCDGIPQNPGLLESIEAQNLEIANRVNSEAGEGARARPEKQWKDARNHEYAVNAGKAMWNTTLFSLRELHDYANLASPSLAKKIADAWSNQEQLQAFIYNHQAYLDDSRVIEPEAQAKRVNFYCIPRIVDERTYAFSQSCLKFMTVMASIDNPFAALRGRLDAVPRPFSYLIPQAVFDFVDEKIDKTIAGFKVTRPKLIERIARYEARRIGKGQSELERQQLIDKVIGLKKTAIDCREKYQDFFELAAKIAQKLNDNTLLNEDNSAEQKIRALEEQIAKIDDVARQAHDATSIQQDIDFLTGELNKLPKDQPEFLFNANYQSALFVQKRPEEEVIARVDTTIIGEYQKTLEKLQRYKNSIEDAKTAQQEIRQQLAALLAATKNAQELGTEQAIVARLVAEKQQADTILADLLSRQASLQQAIEMQEANEASAKAEFDAFLANHNPAFETLRSEIVQIGEELARLSTELTAPIRKVIVALEQATLPISKELFAQLNVILKWDLATAAEWHHITEEASTFSFRTLGKAVSLTGLHKTPLMQLQEECQQLLSSPNNDYNQNPRVKELSATSKQKDAERIQLLGRQEEQTRSHEKTYNDLTTLREQKIQVDAGITAQRSIIDERTREYQDLISQCITELNAKITLCTDKLNTPYANLNNLEELKRLIEVEMPQIKAIKARYDMLTLAGENVFSSAELTTLHQEFERMMYTVTLLSDDKLQQSMLAMISDLKHNFAVAAPEDKKAIEKNTAILLLTDDLESLFQCILKPSVSLEEMVDAIEDFTMSSKEKIYSPTCRILLGALIGTLIGITIALGIAAGIGAVLAAGWVGITIATTMATILTAISVACVAAIGATAGGVIAKRTADKAELAFSGRMFPLIQNVTTAIEEHGDDSVATAEQADTSIAANENAGGQSSDDEGNDASDDEMIDNPSHSGNNVGIELGVM